MKDDHTDVKSIDNRTKIALRGISVWVDIFDRYAVQPDPPADRAQQDFGFSLKMRRSQSNGPEGFCGIEAETALRILQGLA